MLDYVSACSRRVYSLATVGLIALDQCLAISFPFFYERSVRFRQMLIPVLILWIVFTIFAVVIVWKPDPWSQVGETASVFLYILLCLAILTCYLKIYLVARHVRLRIAKTNKEGARKIKQRARASKTSAMILFTVFVCYIPRFIANALRGNDPDIFRSVVYLDSWLDMIALSDCLWDAVICFWRIKQLRVAGMRLLKCDHQSPTINSRDCASLHRELRNQEQRI